MTATDAARGTAYPTQTNGDGAHHLARLPIGKYAVKVEAKGFQTAARPAFDLVLDQAARVDFQMTVGAMSQTVEVMGTAPLLQTDTTDISTHIDSVVTENIPLITGNYGQLTLLTPGAVSTNPGAFKSGQNTFQVGRPYINGNREQTDNYILDGIDNNQSDNNEVAYSPSLEAIQEFNLITQNPSAEFGNFLGGIVNTTIKSGTNSYHGSAFEFFRNDALDANEWSNGLTTPVTPKGALRYNRFGGFRRSHRQESAVLLRGLSGTAHGPAVHPKRAGYEPSRAGWKFRRALYGRFRGRHLHGSQPTTVPATIGRGTHGAHADPE